MTIWYVARAGGILAYALLTASVILGLLLSGKAKLPGWPRFAVEDVHRFVGLLAGTFIAIHLGALLVDSYVPFSLANVLIPGSDSYRPVSVAFGIVAAELLVALAVTNHYRKALSYGFWRRAHYLNFAVWLFALVHGIAAGTDRGTVWALALYIGTASVVAGLTASRFADTLVGWERFVTRSRGGWPAASELRSQPSSGPAARRRGP
jgi:methionine sulfoxide reductase heme-binding subunit